MRPPLSQVVVLVSHLQRPRQRSRLASLVAGLAAGYPDVHIEVLDTRYPKPCKPPAISNSAARPTCSSVLAPLPPTCVDTWHVRF